MLLTFLWPPERHWGMNTPTDERLRPDMVAAARGGDASHGMDDEGDPKGASMEQALYWRKIYREILAMEEEVLERIRDLMSALPAQARREVELTNVPVVAAQADRFRQRLGFWNARFLELE
jgi:hypothetical protein